ncbi:Sjogren's syndrome/scleroderma autoantigen 1 family protein [Acidianus sp. HS-5]|uniref:Sjogren's syndrome/scleroderma autoantigen 1 family protein n=1 Tax=Acidianus sp. HS-5 TaxID=2886040 RepID=UPI001F29EBFA|nr:Sjogren's syndrome/scleroderma autoantigen 1 family protein [Acidianus sp. HS-5]BDC19008.1 hypothetical protein HS5_18980 [Acidianus sp. HS-5]
MTDDSIKKAAELLRQGATMLSDACPICGSPLFKLKNGDVICPVHGKVYIVKSDEEEKQVKKDIMLNSVEDFLVEGLYSTAKKIKEDPYDSETLVQVIRYLDAIERIRKLVPQHNS